MRWRGSPSRKGPWPPRIVCASVWTLTARITRTCWRLWRHRLPAAVGAPGCGISSWRGFVRSAPTSNGAPRRRSASLLRWWTTPFVWGSHPMSRRRWGRYQACPTKGSWPGMTIVPQKRPALLPRKGLRRRGAAMRPRPMADVMKAQQDNRMGYPQCIVMMKRRIKHAQS